jgi:hypothetical protein
MNIKTIHIQISILVSFCIFAWIRYVVFGEVHLEQWPLFLLNKAFSATASALLYLSAYYSYKQRQERSSGHANAAMFLVMMHFLISLTVLRPSYFPSFFSETGMFKLDINLSLLAGSLSFVLMGLIFLRYKIESGRLKSIKTHHLLLITGLLAHTFFRGYSGWFSMEKWPGFLPPISLISFILLMAGLFFVVRKTVQGK